MANILQVTNPVTTDNRNTINTQDPRNGQTNPKIQNPVDPTRVVRADGREGGRTAGTDEGTYAVIDYESNYGAFIKGLGEEAALPRILENLFFSDLAVFQEAGQTEGAVLEGFLSALQMEAPEELVEYVKEQAGQQIKFTGNLFQGLRALLNQDISDTLKEAIGDFLKGYNEYSTGVHSLRQMQVLTDDIARLMLRQFRGEFQALAENMNWEAPNGETLQNTEVLNTRLIPFLSNYISKTHDYGPIRDAVMHLIFHAVRYESGEKGQLMRLFSRMVGNREFMRLYPGNPELDLQELLQMTRSHSDQGGMADALSSLILRGANGEAGLENIQQFYTMLNGLLLNESVYMPLLHILFPFQFQDKKVVSEAWVDPDSRRNSEDEARKIKMFLKFDIQGIGKFEMVLALQDRQVEMQLYVPPALAREEKGIQENVGDILKKNGLTLNRLWVRERLREGRVEEVFPEIREKERTINVRI